MKKGSGKANVAEILEIESFRQRLQCCIRKKDDELSAERALDSGMGVNVNLVPEPETQKGLEKAIQNSPLNKDSVAGQPGRLSLKFSDKNFMSMTNCVVFVLFCILCQ